jgi:uncharacterized protein YegP (UPF0339 family)
MTRYAVGAELNGVRVTRRRRAASLRVQKPRFEIYQDASNVRTGWRWRLVSRNGKILADSGESYTRKHGVKRALGAILEAVGSSDLLVVDA